MKYDHQEFLAFGYKALAISTIAFVLIVFKFFITKQHVETVYKNQLIKDEMYLEFKNPMPVVTPKGEGYAIYVRDGGTFENDIWAVTLEKGGDVLHFRSDQIKMYLNGTFDIIKPNVEKTEN